MDNEHNHKCGKDVSVDLCVPTIRGLRVVFVLAMLNQCLCVDMLVPSRFEVGGIEMNFIQQQGGYDITAKVILRCNGSLSYTYFLSLQVHEVKSARYLNKSELIQSTFLGGHKEEYFLDNFFPLNKRKTIIVDGIIGKSIGNNSSGGPVYLDGTLRLVTHNNTHEHIVFNYKREFHRVVVLTGLPIPQNISIVHESLLYDEFGIQYNIVRGTLVNNQPIPITTAAFTTSYVGPPSSPSVASDNYTHYHAYSQGTFISYVYISLVAVFLSTMTGQLFKSIRLMIKNRKDKNMFVNAEEMQEIV